MQFSLVHRVHEEAGAAAGEGICRPVALGLDGAGEDERSRCGRLVDDLLQSPQHVDAGELPFIDEHRSPEATEHTPRVRLEQLEVTG